MPDFLEMTSDQPYVPHWTPYGITGDDTGPRYEECAWCGEDVSEEVEGRCECDCCDHSGDRGCVTCCKAAGPCKDCPTCRTAAA